MNFSQYMNEWLYGNDGYYAKYREIGKEGDFYTAVSSSQFFGGSIAKEIINLIEKGKFSEKVTICEIGAHKGYLISDVIQFIYTLKPELLETLSFVVIERFERLQEEQRRYFQTAFGDAIQIGILSSLSQFQSEETIFIANELFDAFPCELYYKGKIAVVSNHNIEFIKRDSYIDEVAKKYGKEKGEIAIGYYQFAKEMAESSKKFQFITFDYGDKEPRLDFSIRIYHKHRVYPLFEEGLDISSLFKKSDITYDVDFQFLEDEFRKAGIEMVEYKTQMRALVDFGLIELLELLHSKVSEKVYLSELNRAKILIDPAFMGERFKMMRFEKR